MTTPILRACRFYDRSGAATYTESGPRTAGRRRLSLTWPLAVLFVAYPGWWLLGVSSFTWIIAPIPMLGLLIWRRWCRVPVAFILWLMFISWVLLSGIQLESGTRIITFSYRFALYVGAGVLFVYTYNLPRSTTFDFKILRILTTFWMIVVAGGYAGIIVGAHTFVPPFEHLLPHGLRSQPFVQELVQPVFAEVQGFLGFPIPRPAAPFTYSNYWGGNIAVLTPVAIAAAIAAGRGAYRKLIFAVLIASVVPIVFSLNRGMFISLGIGVFYVTLRLAQRGRITALGLLLGIAVLMVLILIATPLGHLIAASFSSTHGNSNSTRLSVSQLAIAGARQSPIFGYGAPQPIGGQSGLPAIGTQGQLWMVLYSNGVPATIFFVGFFGAVLWQTRRARGMPGLWLHAVPLVALPQIVVYGWLPVELQVVMVASALAYRYCRSPVAILGIPGAPAVSRATVGVPPVIGCLAGRALPARRP